jgi:hypothetical protein
MAWRLPNMIRVALQLSVLRPRKDRSTPFLGNGHGRGMAAAQY